MKYYFPIHLDGGNRGCEGIAKGTGVLLGEPKSKLIGLCRNVNLDTKLGIDNYVSLKPLKQISLFKKIVRKLCSFVGIKYNCDPTLKFVEQMGPQDILISTGGDMMCYGNNQVITTNNLAYRKGCKSILWGCSMAKENMTPEKEDTLRKFSLIYARESLSYEFFKSLGLKNVVCLPDPAFVLEPEPVKLPSCFDNNRKVIGINLSNYTVGGDTLDTKFGKEVHRLVEYIINETDYHILLIPHVFWDKQDDRLISESLKDCFITNKESISILDSFNMNYLQIRYVISNCHSFIGGRTHAVISAYSTCVPAIALGYSIKSKGIAKDLQLPDYLVVDTKNIREGELLQSFKQLCLDYNIIKNFQKELLPTYRLRCSEIGKILHNNKLN